MIGKLYDQAVATGDLKSSADEGDPAERRSISGRLERQSAQGQRQGETGCQGPGPEGTRPPKGTTGKSPNGNSNGNAKDQGMTPGARRKKRKR